MVGFNKHDSLTSYQKFIAGCTSGVVTRFATQPLDVIKLRLQITKLENEADRSWFEVAKSILRRQGIPGLFYGHNLGQIYSIMAVSTQFYAYETATEYVSNKTEKGKLRNVLVFCSGIFAGCASATAASPIEVVRVRQMIGSKQYQGIVKSVVSVYKNGGLLAFYRGLSASLLMLGPQVGISFSVFSFIQPHLLSYMHDCGYHHETCVGHPGNIHKPESVLFASSVAGCVSGLVSKTATYPLDLMKKRMQISGYWLFTALRCPTRMPSVGIVGISLYEITANQELIRGRAVDQYRLLRLRCNRLVDCMVKTIKYDGFLGLYRGCGITIIKAQVTNVVAFSTYELVCYSLRDMK